MYGLDVFSGILLEEEEGHANPTNSEIELDVIMPWRYSPLHGCFLGRIRRPYRTT